MTSPTRHGAFNSGYGVVAGLPFLQARAQGTRLHASKIGGLLHHHRHAVQRDEHVVLSVAVLCPVRRPSAVSRFVALGPVKSVDRASWRAIAHIGQKVCEGVLPPIAHSDAITNYKAHKSVFGMGVQVYNQ